MTHKKLVIANWKMNPSRKEEAQKLLNDYSRLLAEDSQNSLRLIAAVPSLWADIARASCSKISLQLAAQDCSRFESGAFTGQISASMLQSSGMEYCLLGHSEARQWAGETGESLCQKLEHCQEAGLIPIFCLGESSEERQAGTYLEKISQQIEEAGVKKLARDEPTRIIIAYEPIWSIGTGLVPEVQQISEVHSFIKQFLGLEVSVVYGGSVKPENAQALSRITNLDGVLVGGASLDAESFSAIISALHS